jgi:excisionase family DNA binding protein
MVERAALFVRLPMHVMSSIDELVRSTGRTKQAIVTEFVESAVGASGPQTLVTTVADNGSAIDAVIDLSEVAALLRVSPEQVLRQVETGALPGRRFGEDWRFSKVAVLRWLESGEKPAARKPGFTQ